MLSAGASSAVAFIYGLLAIAGFVLNSLVMFTFFKDHSLLLPSNLLILSITTADWLMAVLAKPVGLVAHVSGWTLNPWSCRLYAFITTLLGFGSIIHHAAIAVERYLVITRPYMADIPKRVILAVISLVWAFALLWSVLPFFGWSAYVLENGTLCSLRWQSSDSKDASYVYTVFVLFFFVPTALIATAYGLVYRGVRWMSANAAAVWGPNAQQTLEIIQARIKAARMSALMVAAFLIGWTPYTVVSLYSAAGGAQTVSPLVASIPALFAKATALWNPLIYFFMYDRFKASLKNSLRSVFRLNLVFPEARDATSSGTGNRTRQADTAA